MYSIHGIIKCAYLQSLFVLKALYIETLPRIAGALKLLCAAYWACTEYPWLSISLYCWLTRRCDGELQAGRKIDSYDFRLQAPYTH